MNTLEHAKVYVDLPKNLQDEDALEFARAVITLYEIIDKRNLALDEACDLVGRCLDRMTGVTGLHIEPGFADAENRLAELRKIRGNRSGNSSGPA